MEQSFLKIQIISLFIFFLLVLSSAAFAAADQIILDPNNVNVNKKISLSAENHHHKEFQINLSEDVGLKTNDPPKNFDQLNEKINPTQKQINLSEELSVVTNTPNQNFIIIVKQNADDTKTTMDRISNSDRIRFNGRSITTQNILWNEQSTTNKLSSFVDVEKSFLASSIENTFRIELEKILFIKPTVLEFSLIIHNDITTFFETTNSIKNNSEKLISDLTNTKNPILLLLLVPLSGYILIRSEEEKFRYNIKQVLSFCFIIILVASSVITPVSISSNYWGVAYAESSNDTNNTSKQLEPTSTASSVSAPNQLNSTLLTGTSDNSNKTDISI